MRNSASQREESYSSNTDTYNKFFAVVSSASMLVSWYMINSNKGCIILIKLAITLFLAVIILTVSALYIATKEHEDNGKLTPCGNKIVGILDLCAFGAFIFALTLCASDSETKTC